MQYVSMTTGVWDLRRVKLKKALDKKKTFYRKKQKKEKRKKKGNQKKKQRKKQNKTRQGISFKGHSTCLNWGRWEGTGGGKTGARLLNERSIQSNTEVTWRGCCVKAP